MKTVEEIENIMKFFLSHQIKKGKPLVLPPTFYHSVGVKKGSISDSIYILPIFREFLGEDYIKKIISNIEGKIIDINYYDDIEIGGYDFQFKFKVDDINEYRGSVFLEISVEIEPGGEVTLIMGGGETFYFEEWEEMEDGTWSEVKMEITDLIIEILRHEITDYTGINDISINKIKYF
jgi:hypothetical protein